MKNIKEKAMEFAKENINSFGFISQEHFDGYVAGANYVLDIIEEFMKHNLVHSGNIKRLIEQLKK